jgi:hypothetical protein
VEAREPDFATMSTHPSTQAPASSIDEFAAFVARYHTDVALCKLHFARLMLGLGGAVLVVVFNYFRIGDHGAEAVVTQTAMVVCALHVLACLVTLFLARRRFLADFSQRAESLKDRAWQVAQFVQRRGNILLLLAATGHVLVVIGTEFRLRLFASDGDILLVALIPTLLLIIHGLGEVPTQARLVRLYARTGSASA